MNIEEKGRTSAGESISRSNKYSAMETMPLRGAINKPRISVPETEKNGSSKLFYLRKTKQEVAMSYNSSQFGSYLSAQKENIEENVATSLKNYLNSRKEKIVSNHKRYNNFLEQKKQPAYASTQQAVLGQHNENSLQKDKSSGLRMSDGELEGSSRHQNSSARTKTNPSESKSQRPVLQEISLNQSSTSVAIDNPIACPDTPKKQGGRKTKVEVRDSLDKDISVVKNSVQLDPTRKSTQESGVIKSYAVNTNEGLIRNYNEDRVSIILNIMQSGKQNDTKWPKSAFFGVYDGHCGSVCAEYLRDNLHKFILRDKNFPSNPREALREGIHRAEAEFFKKCVDQKGELIEKSGSCALILLVVDEICYIANVGDSRAIMSKDGGREAISITRDHKPCAPLEKERILKAGGKIYRTQIQTLSLESERGEEFEKEEIVNGPYRVFPGRLSVSRTFGDFEAKMPKYGGNPNVVIVEPEIHEIPVDSTSDFILLGCDGVFDKFTTEDLVTRVWDSSGERSLRGTYHDIAAGVVEGIFEDTFQRKAWDNITVILVCFKNMFNSLAKLKHRLCRSDKDHTTQLIQNHISHQTQMTSMQQQLIPNHRLSQVNFSNYTSN